MGHIRSVDSFASWIECGAKKLLIVAIFITACIQGKKNKSMVFCFQNCSDILCEKKNVIKVALSQKIMEKFYIPNINIPNHYPE